ncbi:MAG: hypothetical protein Q7T11_08935, partial [Deltaproteobacteria bacterium]|nr:hypothetical protein [Deltaproteobacteria bacterium]
MSKIDYQILRPQADASKENEVIELSARLALTALDYSESGNNDGVIDDAVLPLLFPRGKPSQEKLQEIVTHYNRSHTLGRLSGVPLAENVDLFFKLRFPDLHARLTKQEIPKRGEGASPSHESLIRLVNGPITDLVLHSRHDPEKERWVYQETHFRRAVEQARALNPRLGYLLGEA